MDIETYVYYDNPTTRQQHEMLKIMDFLDPRNPETKDPKNARHQFLTSQEPGHMPNISVISLQNTRDVDSETLYFLSISIKRRNTAGQSRKTLIKSMLRNDTKFPILDWKNELTNSFHLTAPLTYSLIFVPQRTYSYPDIKSILCYKRLGSKSKLMQVVAVLQGRPLSGG